MSQLFGDVALWATGVVYSFGYPGVAVLTAMSSLFLPVPSQLVLPLAGFLVSQGSFSFPLVWLVATPGLQAPRWSRTHWGGGSARSGCAVSSGGSDGSCSWTSRVSTRRAGGLSGAER